MKIKFIVISVGALFILTAIFLIVNQEDVKKSEVASFAPETTKVSPPENIAKPPEKFEVKKEEKQLFKKVSTIGRMPDPNDLKNMEAFYAKATSAWNDKVASLIINELKLGQGALDKYFSIRDKFYEKGPALFQVHTDQEPKGSNDKESERRLASVLKNAKEIMEQDYGINPDQDELTNQEDYKKIYTSMEKALKKDSDEHLKDSLNQVKGVLGDAGFKKYEQMKNEFNQEITDGDSEALFKI